MLCLLIRAVQHMHMAMRRGMQPPVAVHGNAMRITWRIRLELEAKLGAHHGKLKTQALPIHPGSGPLAVTHAHSFHWNRVYPKNQDDLHTYIS